jgi:hypothetical protein
LALLDANGHALDTQEIDYRGGVAPVPSPWSLPRSGAYRVRASASSGTQTVSVNALPEPARDLGGVTALASWGVPAGAADYLRQHGFVVTEVSADDTSALSADALIVVGDPRLDGGDLAAAYTALWHAVDQGARLLVLEPPPPGVRAFWPIQAPLRPATGVCDDWDSLPAAGSWAPAPQLAFDLSSKGTLDIYHSDGTYMPRAKSAGYPGCHTLFSIRYGAGWVTLSTVPLLQHFQDVRARLDLMTLIKDSLRRKHRQPASPGLAWVMRQRLETLAKAPPKPWATAAAVWYLPPPAPVAPAAVLAPEASDGDPQTCWSAPPAAAGGALRLDLGAPRQVHALDLDFGAASADWPARFQLAASSDGVHWTPLAAPAPSANGVLELTVPAGAWRDFQLTVASPGRAWRACEFSAR